MPYLDHAATTPMLPEAIAAMTAHLGVVGNASSLHAAGRRARRVVEESRESLADSLGARPSEIVLTAGGTESDNLAVKGLYWARRGADPARTRVLCSPVEHHAVLDAVHWLAEHEGATVDYLPVDGLGRVHPAALREAVERDPASVALVTVMWANNEVGTVQPVAELAAVAAEYGIPMHADAVQALGQVPVSFADSGLTALTVTGHKIGGPFGIGALLAIPGGPVICLAIGFFLLMAILGVWLELIVRNALIYTGLVFGPTVFAGLVDKDLWGHTKRWLGVIVGVIASKYITFTTLALASALFAGHSSENASVAQAFGTLLTALALFFLALYLPFQVAKFFPILGDQVQDVYNSRKQMEGGLSNLGQTAKSSFGDIKSKLGGGSEGGDDEEGGDGGEIDSA
ncbi:cysteine desulfurase family protein, partial [Kitasatospora sp. NPDC001574]